MSLERIIQFLRDNAPWIIAVWILLSVGLYVLSVICGIGMTFDSNLYSAIAHSFSESGFWNNLAQPGLESWPPLFPLIISWLGAGSVPWLNGICLALTLVICWLTTNQIVRARPILVLIMFGIALGTPLFLVHSFMWSEPIFVLLFYLEVHLLLVYRRTQAIAVWIGLILVANVLSLQRHTGIFLITALFLAQLIQSRGFTQFVWSLAYFLFGSISFWWWNGWISAGTHDRISVLLEPLLHWDFDRYQANLDIFGKAISYWVVPYHTTWILILIVLVGFAALLGPLRWKMLVQKDQIRSYGLFLIVFMVYYFLLHLAFIITPDSAERYLSPLYPIFVWLILVPIDWIPRHGLRSWGGRISMVFVCIWLVYVSTRSVKNVLFWNQVRCEPKIETTE